MTATDSIEIIRPDDWHLHLRDGAMLKSVLPATSAVFARAIIMPNLKPPVRTLADLRAYRERILAVLPEGHDFTPLMTLYLTEGTDPEEIREGKRSGEATAVKLYPAGATTNSDAGVSHIDRVSHVFEAMQEVDLPLLIHGEVTDPAVDIFDREAVFIERVLQPIRHRFPELRIVMEHITTKNAADYVRAGDRFLGATITPHHLTVNRNALFRGGIRPHMYCLPIVKREEHRQALVEAATSGDNHFFLGTDSAPHRIHDKEAECGCAGMFNAPTTLSCLAQVFEDAGALDQLEAFTSRHGPAFYKLPVNTDSIRLKREAPVVPDSLAIEGEEESVKVFRPDVDLRWSIC
ncbi:dihydroorotase [Faunimonas pinastri]|uniref:Dihydroorotase n=1 Tax=Faunimonas pinastri TaxID=1855383 RepID=A0A1H9HVF7_9HYPH|nr:dihydroorotase [Faunimonas pinastri]SEQ66321.1 dihydroorotase [Faunimonas pinastri]